MSNSSKSTDFYKKYRDQFLDKISPSFCGAKWFNATIWLESGHTTSCHHPPYHKIPLKEVIMDFKAIHNTTEKKQFRKEMLDGKRPSECEYCWKIEDCGKEFVSDRVFKSIIYSDEDLLKAQNVFRETENVDPINLEISFDSNCNLACAYCNPSFSTTWQADIRKNGIYKNLISDGKDQYQQSGTNSIYQAKNGESINPYQEAFFEWWETGLKNTLREIRITGGEPLASGQFWKFLDKIVSEPPRQLELAINSNLSLPKPTIEKLIGKISNLRNIHLYTSCESFGQHAEYVRDGLNWNEWLENLNLVINSKKFTSVNCMLTINLLSLFSLTDFLDQILEIKKLHNSKFPMCSINILRFPSFMSVTTLPEEHRFLFAEKISSWLKYNSANHPELFTEWEFENLNRLVIYLNKVESGHEKSSSIIQRQKDFKSFFIQYDQRRGKDILKTFPQITAWWNSIEV